MLISWCAGGESWTCRVTVFFSSHLSGIQTLSCAHKLHTKVSEVFEGVEAFPSSMKNKLLNDPQSSTNKHRIRKMTNSIGFRKGISLFACANGTARK